MVEPLSHVPGTRPEYWTLPSELDEWVAIIEATDASSTFFRYPITKDTERDAQISTIRREDVESMVERMQNNGPKVNAMVMVNDEGEVVEAYSHDDTENKKVITTLRQAAKMLHDLHAMMSYTLA